MKKGDLKKKEILDAAEQLFCVKGYQATAVQDIIDSLHTSKGSFYHHFVSKESLLENLCLIRAEQSFKASEAGNDDTFSEVRLLDHLLLGIMPLTGEKLNFVMMLLPTFILPEGRSLKQSYCDSLKKVFLPAVSRTIEKGNASGALFCGDPAVCADILISLVNMLWVRICDIIIESESAGYEADISELLHITDQYRSTAERMLSLPYGSLTLIDLPALRLLTDQIHIHWNSI